MAESTLSAMADTAQWKVTLEGYEAAKSKWSRSVDLEAETDDDESFAEKYVQARGALLATPAPDVAALLIKLEILLATNDDDGNGYLPEWHNAMVKQTVCDYRRLLGSGRSHWDVRHAEVVRLGALLKADREFGPTRIAADKRDAGQLTPAEYLTIENARVAELLEPYWAACSDLIRTPAPNAEALAFKVDLIKSEGFDCGDDQIPDPYALIADDVTRLAA